MEAALPALVADERYEQRRDGVRASPDAQLTLVSEFGWLVVALSPVYMAKRMTLVITSHRTLCMCTIFMQPFWH